MVKHSELNSNFNKKSKLQSVVSNVTELPLHSVNTNIRASVALKIT